MSPRPILKRSQSASEPQSTVSTTAANTINNSHYHPHHNQFIQSSHSYSHPPSHPSHHNHAVHFPPSPALTRTFTCHSAAAYDRSPIVVTPNSCALPERGCPGRTYDLVDSEAATTASSLCGATTTTRGRGLKYARDYHPRALAFASASGSTAPPYGPVPPLVHDFSSESDESDGVSSLPAQIASYPHHHALAMPPPSSTKMYYDDEASMPHDHRLAPEHTPSADGGAEHGHHGAQPREKAHRRHRSRERGSRHERSRDPDRIPGSPSAAYSAFPVAAAPASPTFSSYSSAPTSFSANPPSSYNTTNTSSTPSPRKKGVRRAHHGSVVPPMSLGGFGMAEDGCLGGF